MVGVRGSHYIITITTIIIITIIIHLREEGVGLNLLDAPLAAAQPLLRVALQKVERDRLGLGLEVGGQLQVLVLRQILRLAPVLATQRVLGGEHLPSKATHQTTNG